VPEILIVVGASLSWALGSWGSSRLPMPHDAATGTAVEMLIGGTVLAGLGPILGESWSTVTLHASASSLLAVVYLALIGSVLAFTAYVWLLQNAPISQVSTYAYVNPVVAVLLGALLLGEKLTTTTMLGGAIILLAVALVIRAEAQPPRRLRPKTTTEPHLSRNRDSNGDSASPDGHATQPSRRRSTPSGSRVPGSCVGRHRPAGELIAEKTAAPRAGTDRPQPVEHGRPSNWRPNVRS
jgi:uncharacterized membrane protein